MSDYEELKKYFIDKEKENLSLKEELNQLKSKLSKEFVENKQTEFEDEETNSNLKKIISEPEVNEEDHLTQFLFRKNHSNFDINYQQEKREKELL